MKKQLLRANSFVLVLFLAISFIQCGDKTADNAKDGKSAVKEKMTDAEKAKLPNYRYVDLDSILSAYNLAKDYNEEMLRLQTNFESTARQRESSIQSFASEVQKKMQNNAYLSEASYKQDEQKYTQMQSSAQNELSKMQNNMQTAAMEAQKIVNDSITSFIEEYNKKHGYDAIFFKAATLYIDSRLDITDEVIAGLNARYNKLKKK